MAAWLATQGHVVNRKRVQRLMRLAGLVAIYQRPQQPALPRYRQCRGFALDQSAPLRPAHLPSFRDKKIL
jgi:putative transposase